MAGNDLEQRVVELETRLAFQEQALAELGDALAESRLEAARQSELLRQALQDVKLARAELLAFDSHDPASEPPPPHY